MTINCSRRIISEIAINNSDVMMSLKPGSKLVADGDSFKVEDRIVFQVARRAFTNAFSPELVDATLFTLKYVMDNLKDDKRGFIDSNLPKDRILKAQKNFSGCVESVNILASTYREEAKNCYIESNKQQKLLTADKLDAIYNKYKPKKTKKTSGVSGLIAMFNNGSSQRSAYKKTNTTSIIEMNPQELQNKKTFKPVKVQEKKSLENSNIEVKKEEHKKAKLSSIEKQLARALRDATSATLDEAKRKMNKPFSKNSKLRSFLRTKPKHKPDSLHEELTSIFSENLPSMKKAYDRFEEHIENRRKQALQKRISSTFNSKMIQQKKELIEDCDCDGVIDDAWGEEIEREYHRNILIQNTERRPLTRSISVYPSYEHISKRKSANFEVKPFIFGDEILDLFAKRRTCIQGSMSEDSASEDEYIDVFESESEKYTNME
ncbi:MAG: hypothetical protein VX777_10750 [Chlamydiota bacterium]|nr:hypothetical protein [Chlamydiota bacterium]